MAQYPITTPDGFTYKNIVNAGTTVVKAAAGLLDAIVINGGSATATLKIFDQATTVTGTVSVGSITLGVAPVTPVPTPYHVLTNTGIVIVSTGTIDATITYR